MQAKNTETWPSHSFLKLFWFVPKPAFCARKGPDLKKKKIKDKKLAAQHKVQQTTTTTTITALASQSETLHMTAALACSFPDLRWNPPTSVICLHPLNSVDSKFALLSVFCRSHSERCEEPVRFASLGFGKTNNKTRPHSHPSIPTVCGKHKSASSRPLSPPIPKKYASMYSTHIHTHTHNTVHTVFSAL